MNSQVPHENSVSRFHCKSRDRNTLKPLIGNEILYEISNRNGVTAVNFATPKSLIVKSTTFPITTLISTFALLMRNHIIRLIIHSEKNTPFKHN